jgi:hypothetical protein
MEQECKEPKDSTEIRYKIAENIVHPIPTSDEAIKRRYIEGLINNGAHISLVQYLRDPNMLGQLLSLLGDCYLVGVKNGIEMSQKEAKK